MKLDHLKTFYIVARTGSFTKAADEMNIDQSSVSRKIIDLEARTKTRLFMRLPRGLALTREGEELLERARGILNEIEALKTFGERDMLPSGKLTVCMANALASMTVMDYVPGFLETHPGMELSFLSHDQSLDLTMREADVAIRPYTTSGSDLCQKYLLTYHFYLYASPQYLKQFGVPKTPEDLMQHRLIGFGDSKDRPHVNINWNLRVGLPFGQTHKPFFQANNLHALLKAARLNLGIIGFMEETNYVEEYGLVKVLPELKGPEVDIFYVYPKELGHSKFVTCFGEYMEKSIPHKHKIKASKN